MRRGLLPSHVFSLHINAYICLHMYTYACIYICIHLCLHMYTYVYIYICIHFYIYVEKERAAQRKEDEYEVRLASLSL